MASTTYLFGKHPLKEALKHTKSRGVVFIDQLFITKGAEADTEIMSLAQSNKLTYSVVTASEIESMVGKDAVHQGVLATLIDKALYTSLSDVLLMAEKQKEEGKNPLFVMLDELQDPHNVGAIIRSALAFGATAVIMPEYNQTQITGTVIKSSAGASFSIPVVRVTNVNATLINLKEKGFWVYGLTGDGDTVLSGTVFDSPSVLVIGSEGDGIAEKTLLHCDFKLSIAIDKKCESLNASNAAAVTLYEWKKQQ